MGGGALSGVPPTASVGILLMDGWAYATWLTVCTYGVARGRHGPERLLERGPLTVRNLKHRRKPELGGTGRRSNLGRGREREREREHARGSEREREKGVKAG